MVQARLVFPTFTVNPDNIKNIAAHLSSSIDGSEVAVDTCEAVIIATSPVNPQTIRSLPYGTEILYYEGTTLIGLWYLESVSRVARDEYQLSMISALGLLEDIPHVGGIYTGQTVNSLLSEIIDGAFSYTVDASIQSWKVYGWLPYDTARENLHQLLLAMGVNIFKNADGSFRFGTLNTAYPVTVSDSNVYLEGRVDYGTPATSVAVTEHQWTPFNVAAEVLFDNTDGSVAADHTIVKFSDPCFDLSASGNLTVNSSGVNYAELTGVGVLTGKPYTHIQRVIRKTSGAANVKPREVSVSDAYLVNGLNSLNVSNRLLSYYADSHKITGKMLLGNVKPGSAMVISNAYGEIENAIMSKMDVLSSGTLAASFEASADYTPGASGNNYTHRALVVSSGTWSKPAGYTKIRVALIGGGQGGQSGGNGGKGQAGNQGGGGVGGVGGQPGIGGNIYVIDIDVPSAATVFTVTRGAGGAGGDAPSETTPGGVNYGVADAAPVDGSPGGASTVSYTVGGVTKTLTSANGQPSANGYVDIINGDAVGIPGEYSGVAGGAGGGQSTPAESVTYGGTTWVGGTTGSNAYAGGGVGGGAAVGNNGGNGMDSERVNNQSYGGNGGKGADAIAQTFSGVYGQGGNGGHGSGGGGAGGTAASVLLVGDGGNPGVAGSGSVGGDGCIIFYY